MSIDVRAGSYEVSPNWTAGLDQRRYIRTNPEIRDLLARAAVTFFGGMADGILVASKFVLTSDGEDEVLFGEHRFDDGSVRTTEHTVSPRYAEDCDDSGVYDNGEQVPCAGYLEEYYVLESESPDAYNDFGVMSYKDVAAFEGLVSADIRDTETFLGN